ncbi:MAG: hypothetical protein ABI614_27655, partial [Planctomycetota bacterium]
MFNTRQHLPVGDKMGEHESMAKSEDREPDAAAKPQGFSEVEFKAKLREIGRLREPTGKVPK